MTSPTSGPTRQSWVPLVVLATGVSMVVIDATIVNVAVPAILADLRLGATDVEWINSVYSLMFAALLIPFGRMGDLYGRRRLFALGVAVFLLASVLAAVSVNGPMLIAVRAVQGVGAAMAVPMTLAIINQIYTGRQRVIAFAVWGSIIGGMAAAGPLAGAGSSPSTAGVRRSGSICRSPRCSCSARCACPTRGPGTLRAPTSPGSSSPCSARPASSSR